ncbi:MAG: CRISPR-associated endonuclease Cas2 [Saprospiraceae bacterium]
MPHLICYDISANTLRTKISRKIQEYGLDRINKSVYLGNISESSLTNLELLIHKWLQAKGDPQDSLIIIPVTAAQIHQMKVYGLNELDKEELSGDKSTLII